MAAGAAMNIVRVVFASSLLAGAVSAGGQQAEAVSIDPAQRIAWLESEVNRLRDELALQRRPALAGVPARGAMTPARVPTPPMPWWAPAPGAYPPLSPLQAQVAWLASPGVALVPPPGAVSCAPCTPCR
jgi:hypothetical protein